jgi:drug/metabolite transporter (DMT)-like permease
MDRRPVILVLVAGTLFGLCVPFSKALIGEMEPITLAGFLYAGAAVGMGSLFLLRAKFSPPPPSVRMDRNERLFMAASILVGAVAAPILLMVGLSWTAGSDASLLLNLEGVMTAILAVAFFHERGGRLLWTALAAMTIASAILSYNPGGGFGGNGSVLIVMAMACWGLDNNLMQRISHHDPVRLSLIRNAIAACILLSLAIILNGGVMLVTVILAAMLIGAVSYGLSNMIFFYGLRHLGSSRTGTFFSVGPYAAAMAAIPLLGEPITVRLLLAGLFMLAGTLLLSREKKDCRPEK